VPRHWRRRALYAAPLAAALLLLSVLAGAAQAQQLVIAHWPHSPVSHPRDEPQLNADPTFSLNLRGNFGFAANTLLTCQANLNANDTEQSACLTASNNELNMQNVNVDPGGGRFNSSRATLTLPEGARVVQAYLYWGADLAAGIPPTSGPRTPAPAPAPGGATPWDPESNPGGENRAWTQALMRAGSGGAYELIDARAAGRDGAWQGIASWYADPTDERYFGFTYQVRANVTQDLRAALETATRRRTRSGQAERVLPVTVANVQAGTGGNRHAGWTLMVAYELPSAAWRNLTLFDGFAYVQVQGGEQRVVGPLRFTGFRTPAGGAVQAHAATWTYEGDRGITGDYLTLGRLSQDCTEQQRMSDAVNPANNFFNGTISAAGAHVAGRTPAFENQLGFDRDRPSVPEGVIPNDAHGASACLGTSGDTYFFGGIAFDTRIGSPDLAIDKRASEREARPGEEVTYTTTVRNREGAEESATDVVVEDRIPAGLDFVRFTRNPGDACRYDADTRTITCDAGRLDPGDEFTFAYVARVAAAAQGTQPAHLVNTACFSARSDRQDEDNVFRGCDDASVEVPPNPYADLGVVKTVSDDVVSPGADVTWTLVATNHGPQTSTNFVLRDRLPSGVRFVGLTAEPPLSCTTPAVGSTGSVVCTAPSVAAGTSLTVTITATVPPGTRGGTVLRNITTVSGDQPEPTPDPNPNADESETTVIAEDPSPDLPPGPPDPNGPTAPPVPPVDAPLLAASVSGTRLSLTKQATPGSVTPGERVAFRLRVRNTGEARATNVRVCDRLPRGLAVVSAPGFRRVAGRLWCRSLGSLDIGSARVMRITVRATASAARSVRNVATARARNARYARAGANVRVGALPPPPVTAG
jgi:uncharacterized repeat protein (TIGR01451 family)